MQCLFSWTLCKMASAKQRCLFLMFLATSSIQHVATQRFTFSWLRFLSNLKKNNFLSHFFSGNMERNTAFPLFAGNHSHANSTCSRDNVLKNVVFPILYSFLFLVGMSLNGLAVWIFLRIPSQSHFIIYLKNIVVADVIMTFTFPFKVCHACISKSKWVKDSLMVNYKIIGIS